jgi:arginyl-tRNA synthetase
MVVTRLARFLSSLSFFADCPLPALCDALVIPPQRKIRSIALDLAKLQGEDRVSRESIAGLAKDLAGVPEIASCVAVFPRLYFDLQPPVLIEILEDALAGGAAGFQAENAGRLINVSFCSPNTNKSLHLGHARNMFLGMAVSRLFERAGFDVFRTCNYSDAGVHIMKAYAAFQKLGGTPELRDLPADVVASRCYQAYGASPGEFDDPQELLDRSLQPGSPLFGQVREWTDGVIARFEQTFRAYGVSFHWTLRESENLPWIEEIARMLESRGLLRRQENGDAFVEVPNGDQTEQVFLLRTGGSPLYMSQLLSSGVRRFERFGSRLEQICALAGAEQKEVFDLLHRVQEHCDIPCSRRYRYFDFGLVFSEGTRLRSREANVYSLDALWRDLLPKISELFERTSPKPPVEDYCRAHIVHFFLKKERQQSLDFRRNEIEALGRGSLWEVWKTFVDLTAVAEGAAGRSLRKSSEEALIQLLLRYPSSVESAIAALDPAVLVRVGLKIADSFQEAPRGQAANPAPWSRRLAALTAQVLADSARLCNLDLATPSVVRASPG